MSTLRSVSVPLSSLIVLGAEFIDVPVIYMPHSYFVTDHKQAWRENPSTGLLPGEIPLVDDGTDETRWAIEEDKRWRMRRGIFPNIRDDTFIFANFNQLYKVRCLLFASFSSPS